MIGFGLLRDGMFNSFCSILEFEIIGNESCLVNDLK